MRSVLLVLAMSGACAAQPAPTPASAPTSEPTSAPGGTEISTDDLLDAMERAGTNLHTLKAGVEMKAESGAFGRTDTQNGTIWIERLPDGDTRGRVRFDDHTVGDHRFVERHEFLLEGDWVVERDYGPAQPAPGQTVEKKETRRQVRRPGEKTDLLKLGEGPFPLPIGQPRDRVKELFEVNRLPDDADHPGLVVLELRPKEGTRLAQQYQSITLWVDPADALPRVVQTVDADGEVIKTTTLKDVQINAGVTNADFTLEPISGQDWQMISVPFGNN